MFSVYALLSRKKNWIYVGMTENFERRFEDHNRGYNKSTKVYAPFTLIQILHFETRMEARKAEKYYKSAAGKRKLRKIIMGGPGPV